jgi:hypothetical protein
MASNEGGNKLDKAFELLHQGKSLQAKGKHWDAADCLVQARIILQDLAKEQPTSTEEEQKIGKLYDEQALEYLHQSRQCLIEAMKSETEHEAKPGSTFAMSSLTNEQAETRIRTFYSLFSRPINIQEGSPTKQEEEKNIIDQQWSIEERLLDLNKSLPSGFKTSEERMGEINRGLNKLGLSLYDQREPFSRLQEEIPKSTEEQIDDIIAQAQDEVTFDKKFGSGPTDAPNKVDDDDDSDSNDDSAESEDEEDYLLDDRVLAVKKIRKQAIKAQVKLAELIAVLDQAKSAMDKEDDDKDLKDEDSDDTDSLDHNVEGKGSAAYLSLGKKNLKGARKDIKNALAEWQENL